MTTATIFGKGNMGTAIMGIFEDADWQVQILDSKTAPSTTIEGSIVILAVPYPALTSITGTFSNQFKGRIVVDITNPVDFNTMDSLLPAADSSAAAELQTKLPDSQVLKAFNTMFAGNLSSKKVGPNQATVLIAGDSKDAKSELANVIKKAGLNAIDAGSLKRARELEAMGFLQLAMGVAGKLSFDGGFAILQ